MSRSFCRCDRRLDARVHEREQVLAGVAGRVERARLDERLDRLLVHLTHVDTVAEVVQRGERARLPRARR